MSKHTIGSDAIDRLMALGDPRDAVVAAYELGFDCGQREMRRSVPLKVKVPSSFRQRISPVCQHRSSLEDRWHDHLRKIWPTIEYEPERIRCKLDGIKTSYTPDFRVKGGGATPTFYIEVKPDDWRNYRISHFRADHAQLRRMQVVVKSYHKLLYVVVGEPEKHEVWQPLGFDINEPDSAQTLVRSSLPT